MDYVFKMLFSVNAFILFNKIRKYFNSLEDRHNIWPKSELIWASVPYKSFPYKKKNVYLEMFAGSIYYTLPFAFKMKEEETTKLTIISPVW